MAEVVEDGVSDQNKMGTDVAGDERRRGIIESVLLY